MKERHHVAVQMEEEQQWEKDNGPIDITADQLWKYSGKTEPPKLNIEKELYGGISIYKISRHEDLVIDYYFRNSNSTLITIAEDLGIDISLISKILNKHFDNLKIKKNENNNKNGK